MQALRQAMTNLFRWSGNQGRTAVAPALRDWAARGLVRSIEAAREQAIADGVRPIPPTVYRGLLGFFPAALLQRARFGAGGRPILLPTVPLRYGDPAAVTLGDVILFRDERSAGDLDLWAHGLTHMMQVQRWGLQGYVTRYVTDSMEVEQEANDNAARFAEWRGRRIG